MSENVSNASHNHSVVIIGGGAGGISTAASLHKRDSSLSIAIIEPAEKHYYQPAWTLVGRGEFDPQATERPMAQVMPDFVTWYPSAAEGIDPDQKTVTLASGETIGYQVLVVAAGLELHWAGIEGLPETLGKNGVTSNYRRDLAPHTWELVQGLKKGKAIFSQPPMPIKCAGAPQKAMYLSCDYWLQESRLKDIDVSFMNAGAVLFGVKEYVPALEAYVSKYGIDVQFNHRLVAVDGPNQTATFEVSSGEGEPERQEVSFDFLHAVPPQRAPALIRESKSLANEAGWLEVDQETLQHVRYPEIFGVGDVVSAPNAKTAAAVRKQVPVVAENVMAFLRQGTGDAVYSGYGSCPLTVEKGKIVLAEFAYGGKLEPTFPAWVNNGTKPTRLAWMMKKYQLPWLYWNGMLKGREWLVKPEHRKD